MPRPPPRALLFPYTTLFRSQLGVTGHTGQFLDVDRGQTVFLNHLFGDQDGVLEVVTVPGHERDAHVLAQRQLTQISEKDRKSTRLNSSHVRISYAVFCLKKK